MTYGCPLELDEKYSILLVHAATESIQQWAPDIKGMRMGVLIVIDRFGADMKWTYSVLYGPNVGLTIPASIRYSALTETNFQHFIKKKGVDHHECIL